MDKLKLTISLIAVFVVLLAFFVFSLTVHTNYYLDLSENLGIRVLGKDLPAVSSYDYYLIDTVPTQYELQLDNSLLTFHVEINGLWPSMKLTAIKSSDGSTLDISAESADPCVLVADGQSRRKLGHFTDETRESLELFWVELGYCRSGELQGKLPANKYPLVIKLYRKNGRFLERHQLNIEIAQNGYVDSNVYP